MHVPYSNLKEQNFLLKVLAGILHIVCAGLIDKMSKLVSFPTGSSFGRRLNILTLNSKGMLSSHERHDVPSNTSLLQVFMSLLNASVIRTSHTIRKMRKYSLLQNCFCKYETGKGLVKLIELIWLASPCFNISTVFSP